MLALRQEVNRELIVRLSWYCSSSLRSSRLFFYGCDSPFLLTLKKRTQNVPCSPCTLMMLHSPCGWVVDMQRSKKGSRSAPEGVKPKDHSRNYVNIVPCEVIVRSEVCLGSSPWALLGPI